MTPKPTIQIRKSTVQAGHALLGAFLLLSGCKHAAPPAPPPALPVEVVQVQAQDVPITREWVATMDGKVNAQVRAQVSGYITRQRYQNGSFVKQGQALFDIDARPLQAAVSEANAGVGQAQSNLQQAMTALQNAQAQRTKTQLDVTRLKPLAAERAVSRQELDNAVQADLSAQAQVAGAQAAIEASKSAIDAAKARLQTAHLSLSFSSIVSPVSGIAGINSAQVGDLVSPATGPLTTVSVVDPILVSFMLSEQEYLGVTKRLMESGGNEQAALSSLVFTLQLGDGSTYSQKGKIFSVNREIDVRTGSIQIQTEFPNPGNALRPGGFGRISTIAGVEKSALLVPQRAILEIQGQHFAAVVSPDATVHIRPVQIGATTGNARIVVSGLQSGENVVVEGLQKVRDGAKVIPTPYKAKQ